MLSILMPFYENYDMLRVHLEMWDRYDRRDRALVRAVIVDDGSPTGSAADVIRKFGRMPIEIRLLRIEQDIPWNQDGARNLGMKHVQDQWVLMTDMDHVLDSQNVTQALMFVSTQARRFSYYMPTRIRPSRGTGLAEAAHPNTFLMHQQDFWEIGGYDEDFAGSYGSDGNFRKNAKGLGLSERTTSHFNMIQYTGEDVPDSRTTRYTRKEGEYYRANFPHLEAKRRAPAYRATNHIRFKWHEEMV